MKNKESQEMYLETILKLQKKNPIVKSIDIAKELNYSRASVSRGIHLLLDSNLIKMSDDGQITLTELGLELSEKKFERHTVLTNALVKLGVENKSAEENACKIEHIISDDVFEKIKEFVQKK